MNDPREIMPFDLGGESMRFGLAEDGTPWVAATDFAKAMGHRDAEKATRLLGEDEKGTQIVGTPGGLQELNVIYEDGIWELIFLSRKPEAKALKARVKQILREIRETEQLLKADDPEQILRIRAVDPACGAGVFLIEASRMIAEAYVSRLTVDGSTPPELVALVLPMVTFECVYGMDIDPVAIDLSHTALWLEVGGAVPFNWLDGNVACVNPLLGPNSLPERLLDVMGEPPPFEHDAA